MLVTTVWMLAADHRREWKDYQRKFQHVETWTAQARISQQESSEYYEDAGRRPTTSWKQLGRKCPTRTLIDEFEDAVENDATRTQGAGQPTLPSSTRPTRTWRAPPEDKLARAARASSARRWASTSTEAKFREDQLASAKKFAAADLDVARSEYELGVGNELPKSELDEYQDKVNDAIDSGGRGRPSVAERHDVSQGAGAITSPRWSTAEADAKKNLDDQLGKLKQLRRHATSAKTT